MNTLVLGVISIAWLALGYLIYGRFVARRVVRPDDSNPTPAHTLRDGIDYSPARKGILFGHHFASIAGAGPIVGPLLGVLYFGWLAACIWIAIGNIFIGAVHDYLALMTSVRNRGRSIADVADRAVGHRARVVLSIFLWLALVLVIAAFGAITADTLVKSPEIVIPTFGLIAVATAFGHAVYRKGLPVLPGTALALAAIVLLIYLGKRFPVEIPSGFLETIGIDAPRFWFLILMVYCIVASTLPVWLLLQPRDYLSMWILFAGLFLGFAGLIVTRPSIELPMWIGAHHPKAGPIWPMLFVIVACGATSGFHSLVSGGTTAKQLNRESDGRMIAYGSMVMEGVLAILVVVIAAGCFTWDPNWVKGAEHNEYGFRYLMTGLKDGGGGGATVAFATGFGRITESLPIITFQAGLFFGALMLNAFVITTLDTSTRLARFIVGELLGPVSPAFSNRWAATIICVVAAGALAMGGYQRIWPVFGATNQLVAALTLFIVSAYLLLLRRPRIYTVIPGVFMLLTTIGALALMSYNTLFGPLYDRWFLGLEAHPDIVLGVLSVILIVLAVFVILEARVVLGSARGRSAACGVAEAGRDRT